MSPATKPANDYASTVYQQLCTSHQAIDEFRLKVLGFLPLATGTGFLFLFNSKDLGIGYWQGPGRPLLLPIGIFGFLITAGLFLYEIYCIRKCESFIQAGQRLESEMNIVGPFRSRKDIFWPVAAAGIIYPGVLAVWAALILYSSTSSPADVWWGAGSVFGVGSTGLWLYDYFFRKPMEPSNTVDSKQAA
jgi:hypothetical protein